MNNTTDNYYIKLPNDFYDNLDITNEEMTVLTLMYRNYMQYKSLGVCSIQMICDFMRVNVSNNRRIITTIKDTIIELVSKGYITKLYNLYYEDLDDKNMPLSINSIIKDKDSLFYVELVQPPEDHYFEVYDNEINYILKELVSKNLNKFNIIRYFIACRRVSNNDSKFGYLTQGKLKQLVTDSRTIQRYNKILQDDLHLIRYNNNYLTVDKHYCTTYIGYWDDEDNFNHQVKIEVESKGLIHTDKIKSNERRSVQQKVNVVEKSTDNFSIEELEALLMVKKALEYKPPIKDSLPKHKVLGNKKPTIEDDMFEDLFDTDNDEYELTPEEIEINQECINLNYDQIPVDVLQMIEDEMNESKKEIN